MLKTPVIYEQPAFGEAKIVISPSDRPVVEYVASNQGNDTIRGNTGKDTITPGPGDDTILGLSSEDTVF